MSLSIGYKRIVEHIHNLFGDTRRDKEETASDLRAIIAECETLLDALGE